MQWPCCKWFFKREIQKPKAIFKAKFVSSYYPEIGVTNQVVGLQEDERCEDLRENGHSPCASMPPLLHCIHIWIYLLNQKMYTTKNCNDMDNISIDRVQLFLPF